MPVIAVVNQKGGVGKTCLATNLASVLGSDEPAALLLDCDPQRSAVGWGSVNPQPDSHLTVQGVEAGALVRQVRATAGEYRWIVIDCPPGITRVKRRRYQGGRRRAHSLQTAGLGRVGL